MVVVMTPPKAFITILKKSGELTATPMKMVIKSLQVPAKSACGKIWFMKIVRLRWQPIKNMARCKIGCKIPGELLKRDVVSDIPAAASKLRKPSGREVKKIMSTRLRSGVKPAGTPRFGKKLDSKAVRIKAVNVKSSGEKRVRVDIDLKIYPRRYYIDLFNSVEIKGRFYFDLLAEPVRVLFGFDDSTNRYAFGEDAIKT